MNIWALLGIEETSDKKIIRRAYAQRSRECHPEERPEEFQKLYQAYQEALRYAERVGSVDAVRRGDSLLDSRMEQGRSEVAADIPELEADTSKTKVELYAELRAAFEEVEQKRKKEGAENAKGRERGTDNRNGKQFSLNRWIPYITGTILCVFLFFGIKEVVEWYQLKWEKITAARQYLREQYPEIGFKFRYSNGLEDEEQSLWHVGFFSDKPDVMQVTVYIDCDKVTGAVHIDDNYKSCFFNWKVAEYGLRYSEQYFGTDRTVFFYEDFSDIEAFCDKFVQFASDEQIVALGNLYPKIVFCSDSVRFNMYMINGGDGGLPSDRVYNLSAIPDRSQFEMELRQAYIDYLYNYEPWKVTPEIEKSYGQAYRERVLSMISGKGVTFGVPTFTKEQQAQETGRKGDELEAGVEYVTLGNAYQIFKKAGMNVSVYPSGYGFEVVVNDQVYFYGEYRQPLYYPLDQVYELIKKRN